MSLNIVFAGTPDFAAKQLKALIESQHNLIGVYTQPDRPAKRGKKIQPSPVKALALEHDLAIYQPINFKTPQSIETLDTLKPDLMVVVAYGLLLPQSVLSIPRYGCINVHASLLPRWRGAAPIQRAIEAGDLETGITIMQMDQGLDTGDMLAEVRLPIKPSDNASIIHDALADLAPKLLLSSIDKIAQHTVVATKQNDAEATYANKLTKQEAQLNWQAPANQLEREVRAFNPVPMSYCFIKGKRLRVLSACVKEEASWANTPATIASLEDGKIWVATQSGWLGLERIQLEGKRAMHAHELINGQPDLFVVNETLD